MEIPGETYIRRHLQLRILLHLIEVYEHLLISLYDIDMHARLILSHDFSIPISLDT